MFCAIERPTAATFRPSFFDALIRDSRELADIEKTPVDRRLVQLEIARVDDRARRRLDRERIRIRNRVRHLNRLDRKVPKRDHVVGAELLQRDLIEDAPLLKPAFREAKSETWAIHRDARKLRHHIG